MRLEKNVSTFSSKRTCVLIKTSKRFYSNAKAFFSIPQKPTENLPISSYLFKKSATFCSFCLKKYENQILFL